MKGTLICPIAIAGTGKSTLAGDWAAKGAFPIDAIISLDVLRLQMTGNVADQSANQALISVAATLVEQRLSRGLTVYMDSTHLTEEARNWSALRAQTFDANLFWLHFNVSIEESLARNARRKLSVPDKVMKQQIHNYERIEWDRLPGVILEIPG